MKTLIQYGISMPDEKGRVTIAFRAPEKRGDKPKGYVDLGDDAVIGEILNLNKWSVISVKKKRCDNALLVRVAHNPYVAPSIKEFVAALGVNATKAGDVELDFVRLGSLVRELIAAPTAVTYRQTLLCA